MSATRQEISAPPSLALAVMAARLAQSRYPHRARDIVCVVDGRERFGFASREYCALAPHFAAPVSREYYRILDCVSRREKP